jgi:lipopolysaccharide export LptBFGC system permease protein LptF
MDAYQVYIVISVLVLALIAMLFYFTSRRKPEKGLSRLAALSFAFILAGIIFGENRLVGYSLLGIGVLLAVIDIYYKRTSR